MPMSSATNAAVALDPSVAAQFDSVLHAPVPFFLAVATVGGVSWLMIWRILEARYAGEVASLRERLAGRDEKIGDLERGLTRSALDLPKADEVVAPTPSTAAPTANELMPLADATRYLAEGSLWTRNLMPDDDDLLRHITIEMKDKLERGAIAARGRLATSDVNTYHRGPEDIPRPFWPGAEFDVNRMLTLPTAASEATNDKIKWVDVVLDGQAVRREWGPLPEGEDPINRYVIAMRDYRISSH